jgi:putative hydrolase of the HAD superfamily
MSRGAPHRVKAILLDALGTLLELQPPAPFLRAELAERYGVPLSETEAERAIDAEIAFYRDNLDDGRDEQSLLGLRQRCAQELHDAMPRAAQRQLPPGPEMVEALLASLRFRVYPEVDPSLADFRARGLRLVVVSNWDVSLHALLRRLGLAAKLDGVITSAEVGHRKPSPVIFREALRVAGASAGEAIHVGDSLTEDVAGARAAGIEPVLMRRGGLPGPAGVRTIASLGEVFG